MSRLPAKGPSQRQLRVGEELRHTLAMMLERGEVHDPVIAATPLTVTEVRVSPDLKNATCFITPLGGGDADKVAALLEALKRASGFLRHEVAKKVQLRYAPRLGFLFDTSFDEASHIDELLHRPEVARDLYPENLPEDAAEDATENEDACAMARKRKGLAISGWLILDKPIGMTSSQAVGKVRYLFNAQKAGHGGTLDPLATGVLPIALGEATKTMSYVMDGAKAYRFEVRWGEARTTLDAEGEVTETSNVRPSAQEIEAALPEFMGEIEQIPPIFSAIKVDGERAYKLARAGEEVELKPRNVHIDNYTLVDQRDSDHATFEVWCGKGTYVRALARDLASHLGTVAYVTELRRIQAGPFAENTAISLDSLEALGHSAPLESVLLPIMTALDDIPALALTEAEAGKMRHGMSVAVLPVLHRSPETKVSQDQAVVCTVGDLPVALARIVGGEIRPTRVLNLEK